MSSSLISQLTARYPSLRIGEAGLCESAVDLGAGSVPLAEFAPDACLVEGHGIVVFIDAPGFAVSQKVFSEMQKHGRAMCDRGLSFKIVLVDEKFVEIDVWKISYSKEGAIIDERPSQRVFEPPNNNN